MSEELKQVIKLFNSGTWYDTFGADWAITTKFPPIKPGYGMNCRTDYKIDVVFKVRTGKGYWRGSKYLYVCNNNTIYLLGSDAGIHHVTEELPSNLEAKVREYKP